MTQLISWTEIKVPNECMKVLLNQQSHKAVAHYYRLINWYLVFELTVISINSMKLYHCLLY